MKYDHFTTNHLHDDCCNGGQAVLTLMTCFTIWASLYNLTGSHKHI